VSSDRAALVVFVVFLVAAFPIVLFGVGAYHWFFRDEFVFLAGRSGLTLDVFRPHDGHWTTVPILVYRALWALFGMRSYLPYQACVLLLHLAACALLRVLMRRAGAGAWVATAVASAFVLFGPGEQNIIWAFQISFTGALTFGLAQLVLADHDGPVDRRDFFAIAFGVLALMSSGVGVAMAIIVGIAMLVRRGYRIAAMQTAPLAVIYLVWWLIERPELTSAVGRPTIDVVFDWVRSGEIGNFLALGHFQIVAALLVAVLVVGLVLAWSRLDRAELRRRASIPVAMIIGVVVLSVFTAFGRWYSGSEFARSSRYVYIGVALTLPALAVAVDALVRRWRVVGVAAAALVLVAIPWNATSFAEDSVFGADYMRAYERIVTNVVRVPEATQVPRNVKPIPDLYVGPLTIGFLLDAVKAGKLDPATEPMTPELRNEMRVRLGVAQRRVGTPSDCRTVRGPLNISPAKGTVYGITTPLTVATRDGAQATSPQVGFFPADGTSLSIVLPGLHLQLAPPRGASSFSLCSIARGKEARQVQGQTYVRVGVVQDRGPIPTSCRRMTGPLDVRPAKGAVYGIKTPMSVSLRTSPREVSKPVVFDPASGQRLLIRLEGVTLRFAPPPGATSFTFCASG
jgi:hypothetical protein